MVWADEKFQGLDLGDKRRDRRAIRLAERPTASIPGACNGWAETQAAYRLLSGDKYDWMDILKPHRQCTRTRMAPHPVVLCLQDTTELDFNGQAIAGLGPLSYEPQRGMYLHPTFAVSPACEPLGVLDAWMWTREPKAPDGTRPRIKESVRWSEGYARVAELAGEMPETRLVYLADLEADIRELMVRARDLGTRADWLLRSKHNRALPEGGRLWANVLASPPLGEIHFTLPGGRERSAREVRQELYAQRLSLSDGRRGTFEVTCLIAREIAAPPGVKPIKWLLTNRTAETLEAVAELIDWYRARREIALLFLVLKEGCRVEALQLGTLERLERALALFLVVAWRIARLMRLGRTLPDLDAALLLEPEEWPAACLLAKKLLPKQPPRLNAVLRLIARLGGFSLGRKGDGEPGVKTIWLGLQRVMDFADGIKFAREAHVL